MVGFQMFFFGMVLLNAVPIMMTLKHKKMKFDMDNLMSNINQSEISFIKFSIQNAIFFIFSGLILMLFGI